mgnify:CR=1 FL=1
MGGRYTRTTCRLPRRARGTFSEYFPGRQSRVHHHQCEYGAVQGQVYLLLITNFDRDAGVIQVRQTNVNGSGAGTTTAEISPSVCTEYDKFFPITRTEVDQFVGWYLCSNDPDCDEATDFPGYSIPASILDWPAHGDIGLGQDYNLAPYYDADGSGNYNPEDGGDYPYYDLNPTDFDCLVERDVKLFGDETLWWVFNDKGNIHTETGANPIGMEIRGQAFAFSTNDEINDMTFYNYELINRGSFTLTETYFAQWVDCDLGFAEDDYVGCDVQRGLGYCYNGFAVDGTGAWYYTPASGATATSGGRLIEGVDMTSGAPASYYVDESVYWGRLFALHERWLYDASYIKLRTVRLDYSLSKDLIEKTPFSNVNLGLFANNVWVISSPIPGLDPSEIELRNGVPWTEGGQSPNVRTVGINVKLSF